MSSTTIRYSGVPENSHSRDFESDTAAYAAASRHTAPDPGHDSALTRRFRAAAAAETSATDEPAPAAPSGFVPGFTPGKAGPIGDDPRHNRAYPHPKNPGLFAEADGFYDWADRRLFLADGSPDPMTPGAYRYQTRPDLCDLDAPDSDPSSPRYEPDHLRHKPGDTWIIDKKRPYDVLDPGPFGSPGWFPDRRTGRHRRDELPDPIPWWEIEEEPEKAEWAERAEALWERRTRKTREREAREARARDGVRSGEATGRDALRAVEAFEREALIAVGARERGVVQPDGPHGFRGDPDQSPRVEEPGGTNRSGPSGVGSGSPQGQDAAEEDPLGGPSGDSEVRHFQDRPRAGSDGLAQGRSPNGPRGGSEGAAQAPSQRPSHADSRRASERLPGSRSQSRAAERTADVREPDPFHPTVSKEEPYRFSKLREDAWDQFLLKSESLAATHRQPAGGNGRVMRIVRRLADAMRRKGKRDRAGARPEARPAGTEVPRQRTRPRPSPGHVSAGAPLVQSASALKEVVSGDATTGHTPTANGTTARTAVPEPAATGRRAFDHGAVARRTSRMASAFRGAERARAEVAERRGVRVPEFGGAAWA